MTTPAPTHDSLWERLEAELAASGGRNQLDVWARLKELVDPGLFRPKLAPDVEIKVHKLRWGNDFAVVANPRDLIHYQLAPRDVELLGLMDGTRTVKEIVLERFQKSGDLELGEVADLVRLLHEGNFLDGRYLDTGAAVKRAMDPISVPRQKARLFARKLTIEWSGADRMVSWLYHHGLKVFFNRRVQLVSAALAIAGVVAFVQDARSHRFNLAGQSLAIGFVVLLVLDYFMVFVHELGHALVVAHNGRRIKSAGFQIYFGSPAFFVDGSDGLMMDRKQRIAESFAGPYAQMIVAAVAALIALAFPGWILSETMYRYAVLNYIVILMNLVPLLELDGYWLLTELIEVPDLRPRSFSFVRHDFLYKLRHHERLTRQEVGLTLYAVLGSLFTVFSFYTSYFYWKTVFGGLIARLWQGGLVTRVILGALALFVLGPVVRGLINLVQSIGRRLRALWRRIRFRLETKWRVEAAEMIDALPTFKDVPVSVLNDLAGRVQLKSYSAGGAVFRQGDEADAFYVVRRGSVQVVEEDPKSGAQRVLSTLGPGQSFGELALVKGAPRTATVRAAEETELFVVDRPTFNRLLADTIDVPDFAPTLQQAAELGELPCFSHLDSKRLAELLQHGDWITVPPGQELMRQGEPGDAFYAIGSGQVDIVRDGRPVDRQGAGTYVGEIALLFDMPRTATVVAYTPVRAFRLDRKGFDGMVADSFRKGTLPTNLQIDRTLTH
ncbi:MAG: cyclic nucleotide-binding domain-containing protein [Actinomycetota bacterium]|nr:cyclic nucleotide-binding domain-containing protein [Actinomycetota bacterium]